MLDPALARVHIVLVTPRQPGNVGAAARAMANNGLGRLVLVAPPAFDPDRARWMAPGAHDRIDHALIVGSVA
ncbi:MAG: tRNA (cytosine(32)/uridine(32)-2'-O)-methyltransferase TrmJ, partial [Deltaproteobacteria bacterium]|nr:tRNA (cytosine(32)/uridine(32)-2'-O)-methyltransferase TrmJ [Deltaproteobacteria bacterium]